MEYSMNIENNKELDNTQFYLTSMDESASNYGITSNSIDAMKIRPLILSELDLEVQIVADWLNGKNIDWLLYSV